MQVRLRDRSGLRLYRFLVEDVDRHGNVRIYFRRKGQPKIRLRETPGTEAFDREFHRAFGGEINPPPGNPLASAMPGTMRWLCTQYYASAVFQLLAPSTRKARRGILEEICQRAGNFRFAKMEAQHVAKLRDEKAAFPDAANNRVKALRQLFAWASSPEYRYATKNPARDVGKLRSKNPDGIRAWSEADAARYEARHPIGTKAPLAFDLLLYTGVRRSDVVRLGPQMLVYGNIARRQHGRGAKARLHRDEGQLADRQNARTADPAAAATKHRRHADRTFGLSGDGAGAAALGQSLWQLVQEAVPRGRP